MNILITDMNISLIIHMTNSIRWIRYGWYSIL